MTLWNRSYSLAELNALQASTAAGQLGITFTAMGPEFIEAELRSQSKTAEADASVSGPALSILAETVASTAATMTIDRTVKRCVGQSISVQHIAPTSSSGVKARTACISLNPRTQLWRVDIRDSEGVLTSTAMMTMAVLDLS